MLALRGRSYRLQQSRSLSDGCSGRGQEVGWGLRLLPPHRGASGWAEWSAPWEPECFCVLARRVCFSWCKNHSSLTVQVTCYIYYSFEINKCENAHGCTVARSFSLKMFMPPLSPVILRGYPGCLLPNGLFNLPCVIIKLYFILIKKC